MRNTLLEKLAELQTQMESVLLVLARSDTLRA
jgi:hypothetical protein